LSLHPTERDSPLFQRAVNMFPLLITGIAGVAGWNAYRELSKRYPDQVIGIRPRQTWRLKGRGIVGLDAEDAAGMGELFRKHHFRAVLNCVGNCALKSCELDPAMANLVNVVSASVILENVRAHHCRLVHLSSDLVFSGKGTGNYRETCPIDPVTVYGKTMVEAEQLIAANVPSAAILRISLPMGPSFNKHAGAIDWIQSRFRAGRPATLYYDEVRSCAYCDDLNNVFEWFLNNKEAGIWHLGGSRPLTLFQIAQIVNRVGGYDPRLLKGCLRFMAGPVPPRAGNVSMCSRKLEQALQGYPLRSWPVGEELFPTDRYWHYQRPAAEKAALQRVVERLYQYPAA
jgi:dTDP-4-dehydrorhamnose reductase